MSFCYRVTVLEHGLESNWGNSQMNNRRKVYKDNVNVHPYLQYFRHRSQSVPTLPRYSNRLNPVIPLIMTAYSDIVAAHGSVSQPTSIKNWMRDVDSAMRNTEISSSEQTKMQMASDKAPSNDSEFDGLLRRYQALQNDLEAIENEIVKVYYERLHDESALHLASSQAPSSFPAGQSGSGCGLIDAIQDPRHKDSQLTIHSLVDLHFDEPDESTKASRHPSKRRKQRKPLSEEEKGRNINKVFMRQNGF